MGTKPYINHTAVETNSRRVLSKRISVEHIVAVNPGCEFTCSSVQPPIDRIALATIRVTHPETYPGLIFLNDVDGAICAASIEDEIFDVGVSLQEDRSDRLLQECSLIKRRRDDADPWPRFAVQLGLF